MLKTIGGLMMISFALMPSCAFISDDCG